MSVRHCSLLIAAALVMAPSVGIAKDRARPASPKGNPSSWFPMTSYPVAAKIGGKQGRVVVRLAVDSTGAPTACAVISSSDVEALDKATCDLAMVNGRFAPATDANGVPVASTYELPGVRWVLREPPPIKLEGPWRAAASVTIDQQGKVVSCRDERRGPVPKDVTLCAQAATMPPAFGLFARGYSTDAKPIDIVMETIMTIDGGERLQAQYDAGSRETVMMASVHFDVGIDGKGTNCQITAQRGPPVFHLCERPPAFLPLAMPQKVTIVSAMSRPSAK